MCCLHRKLLANLQARRQASSQPHRVTPNEIHCFNNSCRLEDESYDLFCCVRTRFFSLVWHISPEQFLKIEWTPNCCVFRLNRFWVKSNRTRTRITTLRQLSLSMQWMKMHTNLVYCRPRFHRALVSILNFLNCICHTRGVAAHRWSAPKCSSVDLFLNWNSNEKHTTVFWMQRRVRAQDLLFEVRLCPYGVIS